MEYGLIGKTLKHSFSKEVHEELAEYSYQLCPLPTKQDFDEFFQKRDFAGINVTIPYKEDVIPLCHQIDQHAKEIGAVNTIVNQDGLLYGYNTDYKGFLHLAEISGISFENKHVMILGTGGTCKTVTCAAKNNGAKSVTIVGRTAKNDAIDYKTAATKTETQILVNTTPVGMFPDNNKFPIDIDIFPKLEGVLDVVYNPLETLLIQKAREKGLLHGSGLPMLVAQAKFAVEIFIGDTLQEQAIAKVAAKMYKRQCNVVLVGMPSCGKSTLGRQVAKQLGRSFIDLDKAIEAHAKKSIPDIFAQHGEAYFRDLETEVCKTYAKEHGLVLSTGGGIVKRSENMEALRQNGIVCFIERDIQKLHTGGNRPLSSDISAVKNLLHERLPLYRKYSDYSISNNQLHSKAVKDILEGLHEIISNKWT